MQEDSQNTEVGVEAQNSQRLDNQEKANIKGGGTKFGMESDANAVNVSEFADQVIKKGKKERRKIKSALKYAALIILLAILGVYLWSKSPSTISK